VALLGVLGQPGHQLGGQSQVMEVIGQLDRDLRSCRRRHAHVDRVADHSATGQPRKQTMVVNGRHREFTMRSGAEIDADAQTAA
jgi:hypothetical protein